MGRYDYISEADLFRHAVYKLKDDEKEARRAARKESVATVRELLKTLSDEALEYLCDEQNGTPNWAMYHVQQEIIRRWKAAKG